MTFITSVAPVIHAPPADPLVDGAERRACALSLAWWRGLCEPGGNRAPTRAQIANASAPSVWPHFFFLRCRPGGGENMFEGAGPIVCDALGFDPRGWRVADAWPADAVERAIFLQHTAADLVMPIEEAGRMRIQGEDQAYRCILLPILDSDDRVSHLLGALAFQNAGD